MIDSTPRDARPLQRVGAALINLGIIVGLGFISEQIAGSSAAPNAAARAATAMQALFGLLVIFWFSCAHVRTSPGLALLKLRVVNEVDQRTRISLPTALIRPLPFFFFGIVVVYPVELIARSVAPVQFFLVLVSSLLLAANAAPLWSGPDRRSLLDKLLKTRVVRTPPKPESSTSGNPDGQAK
jgi:uncharacterized RDD family membrane protein YckC